MTIRIQIPDKKRIALIAHDGRKQDLLQWVKFNQETLDDD